MILKFGSGVNAVDVSDYVETGYNVDCEPLYSNDYTSINGKEHKTFLGVRYTVKANLPGVPAALAAQIRNVLQDSMSITFSFPDTVTAVFLKPSSTWELVTEGDEAQTSGELWDIGISAVSEPQLNSL